MAGYSVHRTTSWLSKRGCQRKLRSNVISIRKRGSFFVLEAQLTMELDGHVHIVPAQSGIEVAPNRPHQARNESDADVHFLVISSPTTTGDLTDIE
jgi:mannose-6-phosphate isomerase-like protein (cupin superfamily)